MGSKTIPTRLYLAHRHGISTNVVVAKFDGVTWAPWQYVFAGPTGEALQSNEPVIAGADGYLHMVFKRPDSNYVWWTYYNGSSWPTAITLNNLTTTYDPSIGTTSRGVTVTRKKRVPTKPTRASKERRLEAKGKRAQRKAMRKSPSDQ